MEKYLFNLTNDNVTLTAYIPDYSPEMADRVKIPAMLVIPGGAYKFCSDREADPVAFEFLAKGYAAFVLRYSLNENAAFPKPLDDAEEAIKIIRENAVKWHIDPQKVAAVGFSAGGHLCAALATMAKEKPNAALLGYACVLDEISDILAAPIPSLEKKVDKNTCPCYIFASREDGCVPIKHSLRMADALEQNGIPFEMHIFGTGYHGFSTGSRQVYSKEEDYEYNKHTAVWIDMAEIWLDKIFNK